MDGTDPKIFDRIEYTITSKLSRTVQQLSACRTFVPNPRKSGDLRGDFRHLWSGLEVALPRTTINVTNVERHQASYRIENVGNRSILSMGITNGIGEHCGYLYLMGQSKHPGGEPGGPTSNVSTSVVDHFDPECRVGESCPPTINLGRSKVGAAPIQKSAYR